MTRNPHTQQVILTLDRMVSREAGYPGLDADRVLIEGYARSLWNVRRSKTGRQVRDRLLVVSRSVFEYWEDSIDGFTPYTGKPTYQHEARAALQTMTTKKERNTWK